MFKFKYLLYAAAFAISCLLILYALNMFPVPGTDSRVFIPPALLFSKGLGFINPLYDVSQIKNIHEAGANVFQFNYYAPFFSLCTGAISKIKPGYQTIFVICALFSIANLLLYVRVLSRAIKGKITLPVKVFILLSVAYAANFVLPTVGRPETISTFLIFVLYILYKGRSNMKPVLYNVLLCALFGLLLATQIMGFYFGFLFYIIYEVLNSDNINKTIIVNTMRFMAILVLAAVVIGMSPSGLMNTINGIRAHGTWALSRKGRSISLFIYFWMLAPLSFGFLVIFISCAAIYIRALFARVKQIKTIQVVLLGILHLFLLYGIPKFILYASPTVYNASQFIFPMMVYLGLAVLAADKDWVKTSVGVLTGATYFVGLLLFIRWFLLFAEYKTNGKDYDHARVVLNEYLHMPGEHVKITANLWALADNPNDVQFFSGDCQKGDLLIIQQINFADIEQYVSKCTIIKDWRTNSRAKVFGAALSNSPQCYSFVVCRVN